MKHLLALVALVAVLSVEAWLPAPGWTQTPAGPDAVAQKLSDLHRESFVQGNLTDPAVQAQITPLLRRSAAAGAGFTADDVALATLTYYMMFTPPQMSPAVVEGDRAVVTLQADPLQMVMTRQNGEWKVDLAATAAALPTSVQQQVRTMLDSCAAGSGTPPKDVTTLVTATAAAPVIVAVTPGTFDANVTRQTGLVLVEFFATWCPHCKKMRPIYEQLATDYSGKLGFVTADVDQNREILGKWGVTGVPTFIMFKAGKQVETKVGEFTSEQLNAWVDACLVK
ncbi:MAG TPA: thioredoxin family protein [Armatimonadota bacterium]|jgi:thioredoxin 1